MSNFQSVRLGGTTPEVQPPLVAPAHVTETATGVIADSSKIVPPADKPADRPAWLPEKFKTPEDFAASYKELETKLGAPKPPEAPVVPPVAPQTITADLAAKGVDIGALSKEFAENNGKLTDETVASLVAKGITKATIDQHTAGLNAVSVAQTAEFAALAGGEEGLASVMQWAQSNLSQAEADAYDAVLDTGNMTAAKLAFQGIHSRFIAAMGQDPTRVKGERVPGVSGAKPFGSMEQVRVAMSDPRYAKDPAYRKTVEQRIAVSPDIF